MKNLSLWLILIGAALLVMGMLMFLSAPYQEGGAASAMPFTSAVFSAGALMAGLGFFFRGREIEERSRPVKEENQAKQDLMKLNGPCLICKKEAAIIRCNLHNTKICGNCLPSHDSAWCEYVPCGRKSTAVGKGAWR